MSYSIHRSEQRGRAEHGWLHARFSFSFAEYHNPQRMGFGALRVINNDIVEPNSGFGMHPHSDMEIVTLILRGSLQHTDSNGNNGVIRTNEVQYMSAGAGVYHSEKNPSITDEVELFQIWIRPKSKGGEPLYGQLNLEELEKPNCWTLFVSPDARDGSIKIKQDAFIYSAKLDGKEELLLKEVKKGVGRLIIVVEGSILINEERLNKRDEMQIIEKDSKLITALQDSYILLFEVPMQT